MGDSGGSILGSSAALGWPLMPDLLYNLRLEPIFHGFEFIKTCPVRGGFGWFNPGVKWPSRMAVHARFIF